MSQKYPGGLITKSPPATVGPVNGEGGSAPGVWTLDQAMALNKQGLWPKPLVLGQLWAWGQNVNGQLGLNDSTSRSSPAQIGALSTWSKVALGNQFSVAIKTDGTLWAWGQGNYGCIGQYTTYNYSAPKQIGELSTWSQIAAGQYHVLAVKTDNTLWSWGANSSSGGIIPQGQLGLNDAVNRSSPVQVGALTNWSKVAAGKLHSLAIKTNGTLWSWGNNTDFGALGLGDKISRSSPVQVGSLTDWAQISAGSGFSAAISTNGTLWTWGQNGDGQLGQNNTIDRSSPVQVGASTNWAQVSCGYLHTTAVKTDGTLWTWGFNTFGRLGLGDTVTRSSPVQIGALTTWSSPSSAFNSSSAVKTDLTLWAWGRNNYGQLGKNNTTNYSSPVQVGSLAKWVRLPQRPSANCLIIVRNP